jgi:Antidote-toxin recognition MazE, bacterial antitoxin
MKCQKITHANINRSVCLIRFVAFEPRIKVAKGNSFRITIPVYIVKEVGWKRGDVLRLTLDNDKVILRKDTRRLNKNAP